MSAISRLKPAGSSYSLTAAEATTPVIPHDGIAGAYSVTGAQTITFYGHTANTGTFKVLLRRTSADTDWTAYENVTAAPTAAGWFPLPDEVAAFPFIKMVLATGTDTVEFQGTS